MRKLLVCLMLVVTCVAAHAAISRAADPARRAVLPGGYAVSQSGGPTTGAVPGSFTSGKMTGIGSLGSASSIRNRILSGPRLSNPGGIKPPKPTDPPEPESPIEYYTRDCAGDHGYGLEKCDSKNGCDGKCVLDACDSGYYIAGGKCNTCPAGSYCLGDASVPAKCAANTYSDAGANMCNDCKIGMESDAGASKCTQIVCDAGFRLLDGACIQCPSDTYSASGSTRCTGCPTNTVSEPGATGPEACIRTRCDDPAYYLSSGACNWCPAGHRCDGSDKIAKCQANTWASSGSTECMDCPEDTYSSVGSTTEAQCQPAKSSSGETAKACKPEEYDTGRGCSLCPAGFKCDGGAQIVRCPADTWAAWGSTECTKCPEKTATASIGGAGTILECVVVECELGQYLLNHKCETCPAGSKCNGTKTVTMCPVDSWSVDGKSECTACTGDLKSPAGSTSPAACVRVSCDPGQYLSNGQCLDCTAGNYCVGGANGQMQCSAGSWSGTKATACTACPDGMTSPAGSTSAAACVTVGGGGGGNDDPDDRDDQDTMTCNPACTDGKTCQDGTCVGGSAGGDDPDDPIDPTDPVPQCKNNSDCGTLEKCVNKVCVAYDSPLCEIGDSNEDCGRMGLGYCIGGQCGECPNFTHYNYDQGKCVADNCDGDMAWDGHKCITCPIGKTKNQIDGTCIPIVCAENETFDVNTNTCKPFSCSGTPFNVLWRDNGTYSDLPELKNCCVSGQFDGVGNCCEQGSAKSTGFVPPFSGGTLNAGTYCTFATGDVSEIEIFAAPYELVCVGGTITYSDTSAEFPGGRTINCSGVFVQSDRTIIGASDRPIVYNISGRSNMRATVKLEDGTVCRKVQTSGNWGIFEPVAECALLNEYAGSSLINTNVTIGY